ncbi:MAG: hypothetical protein CVU05_02795 [Bacteroidetes bacterium HGW-Bacteroidetes-21]|jgi:tetratricopeptide (TPR) repeat protein|nr:MAG: hypothetical protein CVU05_02795 [Bacteroidetes bacterium HGW-Bacteroidetes-21]
MMRILISILLISIATVLYGQNTSKGEDYIKQIEGKLDKAKISIDKTLATPEGKLSAENWYLKGYVCTELAKSEVFKASYPNAAIEALSAIQKSRELDQTNAFLPECINVLFDLSTLFYNQGINIYNKSVTNTNVEGLKQALGNFDNFFSAVKTLGDDDKIVMHLMDFSKINIYSVMFYTAYSAQKCGMNDKAQEYYLKIVQLDVPDEKAKATGVPLAYVYYPDLLITLGEQQKAMNVLKKGARLYPENIDVMMAAIDMHKKAGQIDEMSEYLEKAIKASPKDPKMLVVLAGAYTTIARDYDKKGYSSTSLEYRDKAITTYEKAITLNPTDQTVLFNINYNMGILYYNPGVQAYKKQDEAGRVEAEALFRKAVIPLEKALAIDKTNKNVINMLLKCYQTMNDSKRSAELEKLLYN